MAPPKVRAKNLPPKPPLAPPEVDADNDDFLAFWGEHQARQKYPTVTILGVTIEVPHDIPIGFDAQVEQLQESEDIADMQRLSAFLFGEGVVEQWMANRMTRQQWQVLIVWAMANGGGQPTSFSEAAEMVARAEEHAAQGKAQPVPNRQARRASSKTRASAGTGRTSRRTSAVSTG